MKHLEIDQNDGTAPIVPQGTLSLDNHAAPEGVAIQPSASDAVPDYGMPVHPVCELFPLMAKDRLTKLSEDIGVNGLIDPIVLYESQIVDGRNRFLACRLAGIEPRFVEWRLTYSGSMPVSRWIWSTNAERRHLTHDQLALAIVELREWELREAASNRQVETGKKQAEHGKKGGRGHVKPLPIKRSEGVSTARNEPPAAKKKDHSGETRKALAKEGGVSERKIQQARNVKKSAPELLDGVRSGATKLKDAHRTAMAKTKGGAGTESFEPVPMGTDTRAPKGAFDLESAMKKAANGVRSILNYVPDNSREAFLDCVIYKLQKMRKTTVEIPAVCEVSP